MLSLLLLLCYCHFYCLIGDAFSLSLLMPLVTYWLKLILTWREFVSLKLKNKGLRNSTLTWRKTAWCSAISHKESVHNTTDRTNYAKNKEINAIEAFATYKEPNEIIIRDFLTQFDNRYHMTKSFGTIISDNLLPAYCLLRSANNTNWDKQLVKATVTELSWHYQIKTNWNLLWLLWTNTNIWNEWASD